MANRGELETQLNLCWTVGTTRTKANRSASFFWTSTSSRTSTTRSGTPWATRCWSTSRGCCSRNRSPESWSARYGGEEFVVLCPSTKLEQAVRRAERIRAAVGSDENRRTGKLPRHRVIRRHSGRTNRFRGNDPAARRPRPVPRQADRPQQNLFADPAAGNGSGRGAGRRRRDDRQFLSVRVGLSGLRRGRHDRLQAQRTGAGPGRKTEEGHPQPRLPPPRVRRSAPHLGIVAVAATRGGHHRLLFAQRRTPVKKRRPSTRRFPCRFVPSARPAVRNCFSPAHGR